VIFSGPQGLSRLEEELIGSSFRNFCFYKDGLSMCPQIRTQNGFIEQFNKEKIVEAITKDVNFLKSHNGNTNIDQEEIKKIATKVKRLVDKMELPEESILSSDTIRGLTCTELYKMGEIELANLAEIVGPRLTDVLKIWGVNGDTVHDNANQDAENQETMHKHLADIVSQKAMLRLLPESIVQNHVDGSIHIHDREYFYTRQFCFDSDLRYLLYYGLVPDGKGRSLPVARAARSGEVAFLHAAKALGSAQCNCAGGQGYQNFNVFIAPYLEGKSYKEIKQLAQMFVYEMGQMVVARGAQSLDHNSLIVLRENMEIKIQKIGEFCHKFIEEDGNKDISNLEIETLSLNKQNGNLEWKPITDVFIHLPKSDYMLKTTLSDGRSVVTTPDHSLFSLDSDCNFVETSPIDSPTHILTSVDIPTEGKEIISHDLAFLIGYCIGDGNLADNNEILNSSMRIATENEADMERISQIIYDLNGSKGTWRDSPGCKVISFSTVGIPYLDQIGRRAPNKKIPSDLLNLSDDLLHSLLDGLLSSDGNISRRRFEYGTVSVELISQIEFILRRLGLNYSISSSMSKSNFKRNFPVWKIQLSSTSSLSVKINHSDKKIVSLYGPDQQHHDFSVIAKLIKRNKGLYKYSYVFQSNNRKIKRNQLEKISHIIPDIWNKVRNVLPMEVRKIEKVEMGKYVYDIGVKDNENFVLHNGIIAHNSVFSSIQLFPGVPTIWQDKPAVYKGKISDRKYGEFEREVRLLFKAFLEVFYAGDALSRPFSFPKPEIVINREFLDSNEYNSPLLRHVKGEDLAYLPYDEEIGPSYRDLYRLAFKLAIHNGSPYFESQYHVENPLNSISCMQCCSYGFQSDANSDKEFYNKLNFVDGSHFDNLGSMQVMSLNLPRAAYRALDLKQRTEDQNVSDEELFTLSLNYLKELIDQCVRIFEIKRNSVRKQASPFMRQTPMDPNDSSKHAPVYADLEKLSYVVGLVGLNEFVQALIGKQLHESEEAVDLGLKLVAALNLYCGKVGHAAGMQIALARTPAETTAQRFAVSDLINYPEFARKYVKGDIKRAEEILVKGESKDLPIEYSNGTHCSVSAPISLQKKADIEGKFFEILKGGNIFHIFLSDVSPFLTLDSVVDENCQRVPKEISEQDIDAVMDFGMNLVKNTPISYFAFSKDMTLCLDCHATSTGILEKCPHCSSTKLDHIARITGYIQSVSKWNEAKKQELKDRNRYNVEQIKG